MNRRALLGLSLLAVAAVGGGVLLTPRDAAPPDPDQAGLAFPNLAPRLAAAARIEIRHGDDTLTLQRGAGEAWVLPAKSGYPARADRVREVLVGLTELRLVERRTANPELFARLGVEDPATPGGTAYGIRVLDAGGIPIAELITGHRRVRTQGDRPESIYVRRPGEDLAWLAEGRLNIDSDVQLWIDRDVANLPHDRVLAVTIRRDDQVTEFRRSGDPDGVLTVTAPADAGTLDPNAVEDIGRGFEFLTFTDVLPEAQLTAEPVGEASFTLTEGLVITVRTGRKDENIWVRLGATGSDEAKRLDARWHGWAYQVGAWKEKAFAPRLVDLREQPAATQQPGERPPVLPPGAPAPPP
ncbi:DUF4340 domain-containing protein [Roseomonas elaeocarpi]|uniref:DUF4340 domain-containing protein n=1 Tax=Roseomonas elaeocarpi TaxID=907779 RepID=A0ABV6JYZ6_9PROT